MNTSNLQCTDASKERPTAELDCKISFDNDGVLQSGDT